ncbi:MAG TPA: UDP-N-acetylmuramoyl-tripeptide--D-alanyl-D-alanine ligase, partial [Thermoanaerobaculia bacterium]|nr:UDP-N-acetylmuramoyl-tripeptide--D-alanyl-D-alanine ligase [Thermoanaerobaculia bacterium]
MARLSVGEAARAVGGRITAGDPDAMIEGAAIDSRAVHGGEAFFAYKGEHTDGHRFVADALAKGAAVAVVQEDVPAPVSGAVIRVEDTFKALHDLARTVRTRVPEKLVGITGSAGKTTTKELLGAILGSRFRTAWTPGNLNNLYGFPLSLLNVPDGTEWMVAEMGMSTPGELRELSLLGRPDAAVFTVVRPVHLEFFPDVQAIAEAKSEILAGLAPGGFIVANADDPEVTRIAKRHGARVVWYGKNAEVRALDLSPEPGGAVGSRFRLEAGGRSVEVRLPLHGLYNVENFLAAAACAWTLGLSLEEIAAAAPNVKPASMRGVVHRTEAGFTLVD